MKTSTIIASILAGSLGILAILAGSTVLLGLREVDYPVVKALVAYNVCAGVLSLATAFLLWKRPGSGQRLTALILFLHATVLVVLLVSGDAVARESIGAMAFRVGVWSLILLLLRFGPSLKKTEKQIGKP